MFALTQESCGRAKSRVDRSPPGLLPVSSQTIQVDMAEAGANLDPNTDINLHIGKGGGGAGEGGSPLTRL